MNEIISHLRKKLETFPRVPLSIVPTPCHRLNFLSDHFGVEVYCKRDDMTGYGFGGNKSRKLEFLVGEARQHRCDTLLTCGGVQSNFCRLTAAAGAVSGMSVHLLLGGKRSSRANGNVLLDELLSAEMHYVDSDNWAVWEEESEKITETLESQGKKVFRIPVGGSVPVGVAGYTAVFLEILTDQNRLGVDFDHIIHASGSGGTQAGLVVGKDLVNWPGRITGVSVAMKREEIEDKVYTLASETAGLLGGRARMDSVKVDGNHIGPAYAVRTERAERAIELFARKEGIFLDHVYTGKAAGALIDGLDKGLFKGQKVLFLHTGGLPELFANEESKQ
ncbi:MAG: D-cysteine desulfhydrase [Deltaproteobacteria bacterium HGW-Deltaproteobacteria-15]|jgi:D-cysteine desulfhydrase family pyridoxal phosphate-dependent enzyme|nr:MAG: D-cysteine desulfhydrase [Deltaproteobacteria bacterium HGW-Deltaproteobacteria-15]